MAHSLPEAILQRDAAHLARPMGAERLAELRDYGVAPASNVLDCMEIRQLAGRTSLGLSK